MITVSYFPSGFHRGIDLELRPQVAGEDGANFRYLWIINGEATWENGAVLPGDRFHKGDRLAVEVTPYSMGVEGEPFRTREIVVPNAQPRIISAPPEVIPGHDYLYQVQASDPDDDELTFSLAAAPTGMNVDPRSGLITWKLSDTAAGTQKVRIVVRDNEGAENFQEFSYTLAGTER